MSLKIDIQTLSLFFQVDQSVPEHVLKHKQIEYMWKIVGALLSLML